LNSHYSRKHGDEEWRPTTSSTKRRASTTDTDRKQSTKKSKTPSLKEGQGEYKCEICGKEYAIKSSLARHDRIHTGVMPFQCDQCGERFRDGRHRKAHRFKVHNLGK